MWDECGGAGKPESTLHAVAGMHVDTGHMKRRLPLYSITHCGSAAVARSARNDIDALLHYSLHKVRLVTLG